MSATRFIVALAVALVLPITGRAQAQATKPPVTIANKVTATATIQKIDKATRAVTLRTDKGEEDTFVVGPEVTRFDQLKVGDKITVTYYESLVFQLRKPGEASNAAGDAAVAGRAKDQPGGGAVARQTRTVTGKAIDPAVPSITVETADGTTVTRKIQDKKNIEGVKVGDRIDITYTQALVIAAEAAK